jgi:hypothetical protein
MENGRYDLRTDEDHNALSDFTTSHQVLSRTAGGQTRFHDGAWK